MDLSSQSDDEKISMLMSMGFPDIDAVSNALKAAAGDVNDAVFMLTENNLGSYSTKDDLSKVSDEKYGGAEEFPVAQARNLYSRVFAESWNIPFKRNEALGQCLEAATNLAKQGRWNADSNCLRFFDELLPECFNKLMDSGAVRRWTGDVHQGVFTMVEMLLDLAVAVLQCAAVQPHRGVMQALAEVFSNKSEFQTKHQFRTTNYNSVAIYATSPTGELSHGWLVDALNMFGDNGGFDALIERLGQPDLQLSNLASMIKPFSVCSKFLSKDVIWPSLQPIVESIVERLSNMTEADLKSSDAERSFALLESCQLICCVLWPEQLERVTNLRFHLIYTMIKLPHFSARINALKGLGKLISDCEGGSMELQSHQPDIDFVQNWMTEKRVLFYALNGNLDQIQYTERMRELMDIMAPKLRDEDLSRIWQLVDRAATPQVVDNIHGILEVSAKKFSPMQFEHVLKLVCKSFESSNEQLQDKLLTFLGNIGRDNRLGRTAVKMLDVVWDLARRPDLPGFLVDRAMKQHLNILSHSVTRDSLRRGYMVRCIDDIKRSPAVYLPLKQLLVLAQSFTKGSQGYFKTEKAILSEICHQHDLVSLVASSLVKCHRLAVQERAGRPPMPSTLIDGKYNHQQYLSVHMEFLQFLLKEGDFYLSSRCAKQIWDTLVANPNASTYDQETCFQLLCSCLEDLEISSQREMLQDRLLHLPPASLSPPAYSCLLAYWTAVNVADRKMHKTADNFMVVESLDILGQDYFWRILLECNNHEIVNEAANMLLALAYFFLSFKVRRNAKVHHSRFIKECYRKLDKILSELNSLNKSDGPSSVMSAVSTATNTLTAMAVTDAAAITATADPRSLLLQIERVACIAREYISRVESGHSFVRSIYPHAATFHGTPVAITVTCPCPKVHLNMMSHSHETIRTFRARVFTSCHNLILPQLLASNTITSQEQFLISHITQLIFTRTNKPNGCVHNESFKISSSNNGTPWQYKHGRKASEAGGIDEAAKRSKVVSVSNEHESSEEAGDKGNKSNEKLVVQCGEKNNMLLCELGIGESCHVQLVLNTNRSASIKEASSLDAWNELPGSGVYADSTTNNNNNSEPTKSNALVPYTFSPIKVTNSSNNNNNGSSTTGNDNGNKSNKNDNNGSGSKPGFLERIQGVGGLINNTINSSSIITGIGIGGSSNNGVDVGRGSSENAVSGAGGTGASGGSNGGRSVGASGESYAAASGATSKMEAENTLPGLLMAENGVEVFEMLFRLGQLEHSRINECSRRLLHAIPTQFELLDKLDAVANNPHAIFADMKQGEGRGAAQTSSPAKREKLRAKDTTNTSQLTLQQLLDVNQPGMSPFRLLYNLEALSSKLVRVSMGVGDDTLNIKFCSEFLRCGGLRLLWGMLGAGRHSLTGGSTQHQPSTQAQQATALLYRNIHYRVLYILKHLICGTFDKLDSDSFGESSSLPKASEKLQHPQQQSSSELNSSRTSSVSGGGSFNSLDSSVSVGGPPCNGPARSALLLLTEADWLALVCAIMQSAWHGATRKLNLPRHVVAHPTTTSGSNRGDGGGAARTRSSTAAGNSGDCTAQQPVDATDSSSGGAAAGGSPDHIANTVASLGTMNDPSEVSLLEAHITALSLTVLVSTLATRSNLIGSWYEVSGLKPYLLELLLSCSNKLVREAAYQQLTNLTFINTINATHPKLFISQMLVKAPLPLWVSTSHARGAALKMISQSLEYFNLRSHMLCKLSPEDELALGVSVTQMLDDEISWLSNFTLTRPRSRHRPESAAVASRRAADDTLCAGHLALVKALLTCHGIDMMEYGQRMISMLIDVYLFPAAVMLQDYRATPVLENAVNAYCGKCCSDVSRAKALLLLKQLSAGHPNNLVYISNKLLKLHHTLHPQAIRDWQVNPTMESRAACGFVGLKNGGATCYMNSVLQQLFLVPGVREDLLAVSLPNNTEDSVFYQLQTVFGHLLESELQYHEPRKFWENFRMDGNPVNIREQQDAFEFYTKLVEQIDDYLKSRNLDRVFAKRFEGVFSIQRLCQDCPHRFEREEAFLSLNLTVKKLGSLHSSLNQLVKGELLEGDNAFYCEICRLKGSAIVRTCIKVPPQVLVIQLKRFGYDFDKSRSVKYDDHFKFPWSLDLAPFTADYLAEVEGSTVKKKNKFENESFSTPSPLKQQSDISTGLVDISSDSGNKPDVIPKVISVSVSEVIAVDAANKSRETSPSVTTQDSRVGLVDEDTEMLSPGAAAVRACHQMGTPPSSTEKTNDDKTALVSHLATPVSSRTEDNSRKSASSSERSGSATTKGRVRACSSTDTDVFLAPSDLEEKVKQDSSVFDESQRSVTSKSSTVSCSSKGSIGKDGLRGPRTPPGTPPSSPMTSRVGTVVKPTGEFATPTSSPSAKRNRLTVSRTGSSRQLSYELVGVVVHSGQASAGHYYSYIKDRRGDILTNPNKGRWFKFNDTCVEEVEMTNEMVEHECFGGQYTASQSSHTNSSSVPLPEERSRYWSGYLLFYEQCEGRGGGGASPRTPATAPRPRHNSSRSLRITPSVRRNLNLNVVGSSCNTHGRDETPTLITSSSATLPNTSNIMGSCSSSDVATISTESYQHQSFQQDTYASDSNFTRSISGDHSIQSDIAAAAAASSSRDRFARNSLSELRELMEEGEKRGIFSQQRLPPHILTSIVHHNLELYRNRNLYHTQYYEFIYDLCNLVSELSSCGRLVGPLSVNETPCAESLAHRHLINLALSFLFNTYIRLKNKSDSVVGSWCSVLSCLVEKSVPACIAALEYFCVEDGNRHLQPLLLDCPDKNSRQYCRSVLANILEYSVTFYAETELMATQTRKFLSVFLGLLNDAVPAAVQNSQQYFALLHAFCATDMNHCHMVLFSDGIRLLLKFLLGEDVSQPFCSETAATSGSDYSVNRKWTSVQSQEFGLIHVICAELINSCDLALIVQAVPDSSVSMTSLDAASPYRSINANRAASSVSADESVSKVHFTLADDAEDQTKTDLPPPDASGPVTRSKTSEQTERSESPVLMETSQTSTATMATQDSVPDVDASLSSTDTNKSNSENTMNVTAETSETGMAGARSKDVGSSTTIMTEETVGATHDKEVDSSVFTNTSEVNELLVSDLIAPPISICNLLNGGAVTYRWLNIVVTAYREMVEPFSKMTIALMNASRNHRGFTLALMSTLLSHYRSAPSNGLRELTQLILESLRISDNLHSARLIMALEGCKDMHGKHNAGLLELMSIHGTSDVRRAYQCMKLCVNISTNFPLARDVMAGTTDRWQWAVNWLRTRISNARDATTAAHGISSYAANNTSPSNEGSHNHVFQRTTSAQLTLEEATMLLSQMEPLDMETETETASDALLDIREDSPAPDV